MLRFGRNFFRFIYAITILLASFSIARAQATITNSGVGTAFRYQGVLDYSMVNGTLYPDGLRANGPTLFRFTLWSDPVDTNATSQIGTNIDTTLNASNGFFSTVLDFGEAFNGKKTYLDVAVFMATNWPPTSNYFSIMPRVGFVPIPYATWARKGGTRTLSAPFTAGSVHFASDLIPGFSQRFFVFDSTNTAASNPLIIPLVNSFETKYLVIASPPARKSVQDCRLLFRGTSDPLSTNLNLRLEAWTISLGLKPDSSGYPAPVMDFDRTLSPDVAVASTPTGVWFSIPLNNSGLTITTNEELVLHISGGEYKGGFKTLQGVEVDIVDVP